MATSLKPMERRKKRKALDKQRTESERKTKQIALEDKDSGGDAPQSESLLTSSSLPGFHIGVFTELAAADVSAREAAADTLVTELLEVQRTFEKVENRELIGGELKLEAEKDDGLDNCAPSVRYAVRRLIRGVSSSRECARQGFALGLTMVVGNISSIRVGSVLKLTVDLLETSSSMKGQEVKDCYLGRLFAYGALVRSGRLSKEWNAEKNTSCIKEFTSSLISLATKKRYLQEPAVSVLLDLVGKLPLEAVLMQVLEAPELLEWFEKATEVGNPDALLLALKLRDIISVDHKAFGKILPCPYSSTRLFSDHLSSLGNCLKESTFCQPRVHSVWYVLVQTLLPDVLQETDLPPGLNSVKKHKKHRKLSSSEEDIKKNLQAFCEVVIEKCLLFSSHDRKHLALDVVLLLLPRLSVAYIPVVFSYKLVQCLMDILSTKDSWLFKVAKHFLKELLDWVKRDDGRRIAVVLALQRHSNGKFDGITKTRTVKDLMSEFNTEPGCMLFIQNLMNMFLDEGNASEEPSDQSQTTDDNSEVGSVEDKDAVGIVGVSDFLKIWVIESLSSILKHLKLDPDAKLRVQKEIMKFLAIQGLFTSSLGTEVTSFELQERFRWPKVAISSSLCGTCIEQLQMLLANAQKGEGPHAIASGLDAVDLGSFFTRFINTLCNIPSVSLFRTLSNEDETVFKDLLEMEIQLSREERNCGLSADGNKLHSLRYLLIQLMLQILLRPGEFSEAASELIICCKKAFSTSDLLESCGEDGNDVEGTPELMDVLVDTLLSLLPQSSASMRSAIEQVFKYFSGDVTDGGLLRMLRVIKKDLKPSRHKDMNAGDDDDNDEEDDDVLGIEEEDNSDEAETADTGESDGQTDDSEAIVEAPRTLKELPEASDDSDESDEGMDDDAMFRMDAYLAQIFKERKNQAGSETAHSQLVLFKLRVLSLLEIYLHENPGKPQVLKVFSNLAQAFINPNTTEGSEQLGQRIRGILQKKIFKAKEYPKGEDVQLPMLESLLERNLKLASKPFKKKKSANNPSRKKQSASWNRYKMITSLAQNSTFWILKIIDAKMYSESELQRVFDIFKDNLVAYFDSKKSQMKSEFLKEIFRRRPWIGRKLSGFLLEKCGSAKSQFRRVEALELVVEVLRQVVSDDSEGIDQEVSRGRLKNQLPGICHLIEALVTSMPDKQARRAEVRRFCGKVFQILAGARLTAAFLKTLEPEAHGACESQLGDVFNVLKRQDKISYGNI